MITDQKDQLNPKSTSYVPTWEEMKLPKDLINRLNTEWEDPIKTERNNKEYDYYLNKWQANHREKLKREIKSKEEKRNLKLSAHWFETLQPKEIEKLIESSRSFADEVFDELRNRVKSTWELNYIEELRVRVKSAPIVLSPATSGKLKRFPAYSLGMNALHGSVYTFYKLWAHVFKSHKRTTGKFIAKG